ncbi:5'-methylthioadenosine/S-adenosylhomocysteine nucleosidase [Protofrankia symbiont of Coriaria ruscifolia]|uniref:5'-methylthioadenosine/S-adenosylhomocysteine nucleosidase family protein n=1 Tax=Protofrankia symbiont of Coriaria ruscifolia TaxID=1306542 RepID=UPI001040E231|nr:5'-methylthioadenosine/S-adenosylhomocysteine nucleosidase [Protofrankia symbiont of Coriaria ruscifolia]
MIVILTALPVEHHAVLECLTDATVHKNDVGTLFEVGSLASFPKCQVALGTTGPGALDAAALATRAQAEFSPAAMLFVGIAGGLRDWLAIGDVVVATKIHAYHGGRSEDDEFLARPRSWQLPHAVEQIARRLPRGEAWRALLPELGPGDGPSVHFEAVAAGDVLLNSKVSPTAQRLRRNYNDAVAIEMESSGFALAGHLSGGVATATIRAISDHADGTKGVTDSKGSQDIAARNAAAFAVLLAAAVDDGKNKDGKGDGTPAGTPPNTQPPLPVSIQNTNTAQSGARVDQQIGVNFEAFHAAWTVGAGERGEKK